MRWFNIDKKEFQIEGTAPQGNAIKVFKGEDQYFSKRPSPREKYIVYEKYEGINPGDWYIKVRNSINKNAALIQDYRYKDGLTTEEAIWRFLQYWKEQRPEDWI
jgi:hypothetical protein